MLPKKCLRRKSIEVMISQAASSNLVRSLSAFQLILLGIGAIIGAGIFVLTGTAASQSAGPAVVLSFALSGVACACAGLCYAELSSMIPVSGSAYTYIYATLGEMAAAIVGFMMIIGTVTVTASVASGWSGYAVSMLSDMGIYIPAIIANTTGKIVTLSDGSTITALFNLPTLFISIFVIFVLYRGVEGSAIINLVIVCIKMSVLFFFVAIGITKIDPSNWIPFIPDNTGTFGQFGVSGIVGGASMILLAYNGFDTVATAAQEAKNPQRDLPIGILGSLFICMLTYILVAGVLTGLVNYKDLNVAQPIAIAVDKMGLPWFAFIIKIGAVAGLTSVILAMCYGATRVIYTVTNDGLLPKFFAKCHFTYKTPHVATIIVGLAIGLIGATCPLEKIVQLSNFCIIMTFAIVCFAAIYLRYKEPNRERTFKCPGMPWIPILGILLFMQILAGMPDPMVYVYFAMLVLFAIIFYLVYGQKHSTLESVD